MANLPNEKTYEYISQWLEIYHSSDDAEKKTKAKDSIVKGMIPVVKKIARTIARRATDPIEDLIQAGFIGLLKAIEKYSKEKNDNFKIYAGYFIIGEMRHYLRDKLNAIRVPRHIQELSIRINNFTQTLTPEELYELTTEEVASALQASPKAVDVAMQVERRGATLSLDNIFDSREGSLGYEELLASKGFKDSQDLQDAQIIIHEIFPKLPLGAKIIIDMYYNKDMTKREIAEAMGTNQMTVSRKMQKAFELLNKIIEKKSLEDIDFEEWDDNYNNGKRN